MSTERTENKILSLVRPVCATSDVNVLVIMLLVLACRRCADSMYAVAGHHGILLPPSTFTPQRAVLTNTLGRQ